MKPWQAIDKTVEVKVEIGDTNALLASIARSFHMKPKYWRAIGTMRPRICQFVLEGSKPESWYVSVDGEGGVIYGGLHPSPDMTWSSSASDLLKIMRLEVQGGDLVRRGKVRLTGNLDLLREVLEALI
jgi:hypothetical protein